MSSPPSQEDMNCSSDSILSGAEEDEQSETSSVESTQSSSSMSSSMSSSSDGSTSGKRKRDQVKKACTNCNKAHAKCDAQRPCSRCIKLGIESTCMDRERKKKDAGRFTRYNDKPIDPSMYRPLLPRPSATTSVLMRSPPKSNDSSRPIFHNACLVSPHNIFASSAAQHFNFYQQQINMQHPPAATSVQNAHVNQFVQNSLPHVMDNGMVSSNMLLHSMMQMGLGSSTSTPSPSHTMYSNIEDASFCPTPMLSAEFKPTLARNLCDPPSSEFLDKDARQQAIIGFPTSVGQHAPISHQLLNPGTNSISHLLPTGTTTGYELMSPLECQQMVSANQFDVFVHTQNTSPIEEDAQSQFTLPRHEDVDELLLSLSNARQEQTSTQKQQKEKVSPRKKKQRNKESR